MAAPAALYVHGLQDFHRACMRGPVVLKKEWTIGQRSIAKPVQQMAESRALSEITNMPKSPGWADMRIGVTQKLVYVAPRKRGIKGANPRGRKDLKDFLLDKAMIPALEHHRARILREFDGFLAAVGRDWER